MSASTDPVEWKAIIMESSGTAHKLQVQLDGINAAWEQAANISGFTIEMKLPILKAINQEIKMQTLIGSELSSKRPDGLVVNWRTRKFFVLEFTRSYDRDPKNLERSQTFKTRKYFKMCELIARELGPPWAGEVLAFTVGVHGSVKVEMWTEHLKKLGLVTGAIDMVISTATTSALEQCHCMYQAREAALRVLQGHPNEQQLATRCGSADL